MGDLSRNISRYEIACNCGCGFDTIDIKTVQVIQACADHIAESKGIDKVIVHFNSGCRCFAWNDHEDGSEDSQHLYGRAVDFWIDDVDPALVYEYLNRKYRGMYGIGNHKNFTHFDSRSGDNARW